MSLDELHDAADHACILHERLTEAADQLENGDYSVGAMRARCEAIDADFVECTEEVFRQQMRAWFNLEGDRCPYPTLGEVERFREIAVQTVTAVKDAQKTAVWREREQALAAYRKGEEDYALVMDAPAKLVKALEAM